MVMITKVKPLYLCLEERCNFHHSSLWIAILHKLAHPFHDVDNICEDK